AAVIYFRTGALPEEWPGIDMPDYYQVTDESAGTIEYETTDKHYQIIKTTLRKFGINLDDIKTLEDLTAIERNYLPDICDAMARQHKNNSGCLDNAYINALSYWDKKDAKHLLNLIMERDRKGFMIISDFNTD
ncbi:MAG: hypothetical protein ABW077_20230, partial [Candidatus Thiodiazotropha endolucinida]